MIGLLSGVTLAEWLRQQWYPSFAFTPIFQIGCDGLTALTQAFEAVSLSPTQAQFDILSTIHAWRKLSPVRWRPRHVYGQQDRFTTSLTRWEPRNVECDTWAVNYTACICPLLNAFPRPTLGSFMNRLLSLWEVSNRHNLIQPFSKNMWNCGSNAFPFARKQSL